LENVLTVASSKVDTAYLLYSTQSKQSLDVYKGSRNTQEDELRQLKQNAFGALKIYAQIVTFSLAI